jgi:uncharacterized protein (TIGR02611 family)
VSPDGKPEEHPHEFGEILEDAAIEVELATGHHEKTVAQAKRHIVVRIGTVTAGVIVVIVGLILVPLPGPGWLIVAGGLALLSTDVPFANRLLKAVRRRLPSTATGKLPLWLTLGMAVSAMAFTAAGIWMALLH